MVGALRPRYGVTEELTSSARRPRAYTHVNLALTPGSRLGVYEITGPLGEGGMGQVYWATDTTLRRQVAIKILPDAFAADPERMARFEREAKTLASLNHPNIAAIYGFEKSGGAYALVMELVEGGISLSVLRAVRSRSMKHYPLRSRSPTRWKPRTNRGSSTAISSPRISRCAVTAR